ncbi:PDR/VanB family oxidoreductase [Dietzia cercidiphylli]|uniref:PDR/VanB family oxidoreductase n=1 Tax=Dietzia cercidiphylli TaxID=498199 RepID=UPI003F7EF043
MSSFSQARWVTASVVSVEELVQGIRSLVLEYPTTLSRNIEGGHIDVAVVIGQRTDKRSYSIVRREPEAPQNLRIAVQLADPTRGGSAFMHAVRVGDKLRVTLPLFSFPFRRTERPLRFLAGGIGITALIAMAERARNNEFRAGYDLTLVGRGVESMAFRDELARDHGELLHLHDSLRSGRFDVHEYVQSSPSDAVVYFCGPMALLDDLRAAWVKDGRAEGDLRFETFGTAGTHPAETFTVRVPAQDLQVVVERNQSILDALQAAGAEMMYDCRKGECGLCQVDVEEICGLVDHRDVFFSDEQHQSSRRLCTCVSRVVSTPACTTPVVTLSLP